VDSNIITAIIGALGGIAGSFVIGIFTVFTENKRLKDEIKDLKAEQSSSHAESLSFIAEINQAKSAIIKLTQENIKEKAQNRTLLSENTQLKERVTALENQNTALTLAIERLEEKIKRMNLTPKRWDTLKDNGFYSP